MPRCGTPAGWTVGGPEVSTIPSSDPNKVVDFSRNGDPVSGAIYPILPYTTDAEYIGCEPGEVAIGFFWSARRVMGYFWYGESGWPGSKRLGSPDEHPSEIMPICAPVTSTEPFAVTSGDFRRACTAQICSNLTNTVDTDDVAKCLKLCESETTCRASEFIEGNATSKMSGKCLLYAGTCTESPTPHGRILKQGLPSPVTTANGPVTYTPVEFEHP